MRGLAFNSDQSFARTFASLMPDFARWCWLIDAQSGPFALTNLGSVESRRLEQSLARYELDAPALARTSASLWCAGVFPTFAEYLVEDEWSYLIGLDDRVASVVPVAEALVRERILSEAFFDLVGQSAEILLLEDSNGDGKLDDDDERQLMVSNLEGTPRPLSRRTRVSAALPRQRVARRSHESRSADFHSQSTLVASRRCELEQTALNR